MANYIISTDSTADLPIEYIDEHKLLIQDLGFSFGNELYKGIREMSPDIFYARMAKGEIAKTNASNPETVKASFEEALKKGYDVLHLGFSSGLSTSYNSARLAANDLADEYPERKIIVIDTLCAALGQGLMVHYAVKNLENGMPLEENAAFVERTKLHIGHEFTVDDLKYLARGGRISKGAAAIGTIINIKPVLHVDDEGHLINIAKVRGRKASLKALVDNMASHLSEDYKNEIVFIGNTACPEDAQYVADMVKERFGIQEFLIGSISPTIGAHTGPGCVALFYLAQERTIEN